MELIKEVYINGKINELATKRLSDFTIEENIGLQLDSLDITINNNDNAIEIPKEKSDIEIAIGYGVNLYRMGKYIAHNIDATSTSIFIKCLSKDLSEGKIKLNRVFKDKTLGEILATIANDLKLELQIEKSFKNKKIKYLLQDNKTNLEILAELSEIFYALVTIKDNKLTFIHKDEKKSVCIKISNILNLKKRDYISNYHQGVIYNSWNIKQGEIESIKQGKEPYVTLSNDIDPSLKNIYLQSKYMEISETEYIELNLKQGDPDLQAGLHMIINNSTGKYSQFSGKYRIEKVIHKYNNTYVNYILAVKIKNN